MSWDHLPLYRQSQIFARQGVELDRSTLANWVGGAVWWLEPLQARLAEHVFASQKLFADHTPIPVLDPGRGRTKTGRLWVYARDDRPWSGSDPPAAVYLYTVPIVGPSDPLLIQGGGCPREPGAGSDIGGQAGARSDELDLPGAAGTGRARRVIDD